MSNCISLKNIYSFHHINRLIDKEHSLITLIGKTLKIKCRSFRLILMHTNSNFFMA